MPEAMPKLRMAYIAASCVLTAAIAAGAALHPAAAQERKSIRWATAQVGTYGYMVAASMVRIAETALGGEYTVTVQPYATPTVAMKAVMDGNGEIAYTADIGMSQFHERVGGFKDYKPSKPELVHTWYAYPMESLLATSAAKADQFKCWKDFSGRLCLLPMDRRSAPDMTSRNSPAAAAMRMAAERISITS